MIIKGVKLYNIRSYIDATIVFPKSSTLLAGEIGSGKSSILLAIEFALFGITRGVLSGSSLLRTGQNQGYVELHLLIDNKEVIIKRTLKRQKDDVRQDSGYIIINGIKKDATPVELKSMVLELLGYPPQLLTKSKSLIYRYTVYTPQEEMKQILMEKSEYRVDTLRRIFQIDKYKRIRENTQIIIKTLRQKQNLFLGITQDLVEKQQLLMETKGELQKSKLTLEQAGKRLTEVEAQIQQNLQSLAKLETQTKELTNQKNLLQIQQDKLNERISSIQKMNEDMDKIAADIANLTIKSQEMKIPEIKDDAILHAMVEKAQEKHNQQIKRLAEQENNIKQQQQIIIQEQEVVENISTLKLCPLCQQEVNPTHIQEVKLIQDKKIQTVKLKIQKLQVDVKSTQDQLANTNNTIKELTEKQKLLNKAKIMEKEKQNILNLIQEKNQQKRHITEEIKRLKIEVGKINTAKLEIQEKINSYKTLDKDFELLKKAIEPMLAREKELTVALTRAKSEVTSKTQTLQTLEAEIQKKLNAKKQLQQLKQIQHWFQELFLNLMITMEQHVMMRVYNEFNEILQQFFEILVETEVMSIRLDEEFSPIIEQNGYEVDYENLSGGEKTSIALAYRLALNKVINHLIENIKTKDIIILDEPTDGFSTQQLDKIRDVLDSLGTEQTIIVSHDPKIESFVENIIRITKHEHISTVT